MATSPTDIRSDGHLPGQELHVRPGPGVDVAVALVLDPVARLLPVLRQQDQRSGVRRLQAERQRQEDERVLVEAQFAGAKMFQATQNRIVPVM